MIYLSENKSCAWAVDLLMIRSEDGIEIVLMPAEQEKLLQVLEDQREECGAR